MDIAELTNRLSEARKDACQSATKLNEALVPFESICPMMFQQPLAEMGVSQRLVLSAEILKFIKAIKGTV